ncbi:MAG: hypothetical protein ACKV0T_06600 [Planctomycetales bacterium]
MTLLKALHFLVDADTVSLFTAPVGFHPVSLSRFQQFCGFPFQPLGLVRISLLGTDRGLLPQGPGALPKLIDL